MHRLRLLVIVEQFLYQLLNLFLDFNLLQDHFQHHRHFDHLQFNLHFSIYLIMLSHQSFLTYYFGYFKFILMFRYICYSFVNYLMLLLPLNQFYHQAKQFIYLNSLEVQIKLLNQLRSMQQHHLRHSFLLQNSIQLILISFPSLASLVRRFQEV